MPLAKKRKIALSSEPVKEELGQPASSTVTVDESSSEKASGPGERTVSASVPEGNAVQNQERLERFKALQARAVSVGRFDISFLQHLTTKDKLTPKAEKVS